MPIQRKNKSFTSSGNDLLFLSSNISKPKPKPIAPRKPANATNITSLNVIPYPIRFNNG